MTASPWLRGGDNAREFCRPVAELAVSLKPRRSHDPHRARGDDVWSQQHTPEQRRAMGIGDGLVRISVGAEDERDLLADFAPAPEK